MSSLDWERVKKHFDEAAVMPRSAREEYLDQHCGADAGIRAKVEELLIELDNATASPEPHAQPTKIDQPPQEVTLADAHVGSYRILNRLGRGGMGEVFLAERADGAFQKRVAIKLLPPDSAMNRHSLMRFLRERQILASLEHQNIARLLDGGTFAGRPYVVMEYVTGRSLREVLEQNSGLPADTIVKITRQICDGLHTAHRNGIIHRDIKPENIMVVEDGAALTVKILDFGIAKSVQPTASDMQTKPGAIFGTPSYMSPEQIAGYDPEKLDYRSDIYSLGLVVYEMLTGQAAFNGTTIPEIYSKQLHETPASPKAIRPDLPITPDFESEIMRAIEKNPANRHATVIELAESLEKALSETTRADNKPVPRRLLFKIAIPVVMTLIVLSGILVLWPHREIPAPVDGVSSKNAEAIKLEYSIFRLRNGETTLLAATNGINSAQPGDRVYFEFVMPFEASFYLLYESDGRLIWVNPGPGGAPRTVHKGQKARAPEDDSFPILENTGPQNFLAVYVPAANPWSLYSALQGEPVKIIASADELPHAELSPKSSEILRNSLSQTGKPVTFAQVQHTAAYRQELTGYTPDSIIYHSTQVNIVAKR